MAEEAMASESSVTMAQQAVSAAANSAEAQISNDATIESNTLGGAESTCNNNDGGGGGGGNKDGETSVPSSDADKEKSLELAAELTEQGSKALKEGDYGEAADCFSRALEIRVSYYGELAPECMHAYYQYGRTLLYKAQEEADPLGAMPKKDGEAKLDSDKDGSVKSGINAESSTASASNTAKEDKSSVLQGEEAGDASSRKELEDDEESEDEDLAEADEDESDLDLAWKMLDVARAIAEKHSGDSMDKVDILSALAEVALEREDIETSLSDYQKALSMLEQLVDPDSRQIAELNFRICLCLEIGSMPQEAIPYCQKAISVCKLRLQRLMNELKGSSEPATSSAVSELEESVQQSSSGSQIDKLVKDKESEIETLTGLSAELEKKLEDLQQLALNPKSILSEILGMASAKAKCDEKSSSSAVRNSSQMAIANSSGGFDSPTISTAHTNGADKVTHLGVVGRGVKRMNTGSGSVESSSMKKTATEPSSEKGGSNGS